MDLGYGWLNLCSLILGLLAWFLPIFRIARLRHNESRRSLHLTSALSLSACALALCLQVFYNHHLVRIEDWSALLDTSRAVAIISAVLLAVTLLLNLPLLLFGTDPN